MKTFTGKGYPQAFVRSAAVPRPPRESSIDSDDSDDDETAKREATSSLSMYSERIRKVC